MTGIGGLGEAIGAGGEGEGDARPFLDFGGLSFCGCVCGGAEGAEGAEGDVFDAVLF